MLGNGPRFRVIVPRCNLQVRLRQNVLNVPAAVGLGKLLRWISSRAIDRYCWALAVKDI